MRKVLLVAAAASWIGCGAASSRHGGGGGAGGGGSNGTGGNNGGGGASGGPCNATNPNGDVDGDGYTPAQGDCNDCDPNFNPGAVDVMADNDCDGKVDAHSVCDTGLVGKTDAASVAAAMDICDARFLKS